MKPPSSSCIWRAPLYLIVCSYLLPHSCSRRSAVHEAAPVAPKATSSPAVPLGVSIAWPLSLVAKVARPVDHHYPRLCPGRIVPKCSSLLLRCQPDLRTRSRRPDQLDQTKVSSRSSQHYFLSAGLFRVPFLRGLGRGPHSTELAEQAGAFVPRVSLDSDNSARRRAPRKGRLVV